MNSLMFISILLLFSNIFCFFSLTICNSMREKFPNINEIG